MTQQHPLDQMVAYGEGPIPFFNLLAKWRNTGDFAGLTIE